MTFYISTSTKIIFSKIIFFQKSFFIQNRADCQVKKFLKHNIGLSLSTKVLAKNRDALIKACQLEHGFCCHKLFCVRIDDSNKDLINTEELTFNEWDNESKTGAISTLGNFFAQARLHWKNAHSNDYPEYIMKKKDKMKK